jgi:phosphate starvation-inducible protein PhoH and related proteins
MKRAQKTQDLMVKKEKFQRQQFPSLVPKTENQRLLLEAMKYDSIVVASGSAGTGKSLCCCWHAARKLYYGDIKKIVLIRAYQPLAGRSIGLLPGTLQEKLQPYYQQMIDYFEDFLGKASTEIHLKQGTIEICSLETIRGRSWDDAILYVEEAQNLFVPEIQALTTRIGTNTQMLVCGDNAQSDVRNSMNGLSYLQKIVDKYSIPDVSFTNFTRDDICRSDITKEFVIAYEEELYEDAKGKAIISQVDQDKQFKKGR